MMQPGTKVSPLERLQRGWERTPMAQHLGLKVVAAADGYVRLRMATQPWMLNEDDGSLHGGILATLVDMAVGCALWGVYDVGQEISGHTTIELNISYLAPAMTAEVIVEGRAVRKGRTLFVGSAEIMDTRNRPVASGRATYMVFRQE